MEDALAFDISGKRCQFRCGEVFSTNFSGVKVARDLILDGAVFEAALQVANAEVSGTVSLRRATLKAPIGSPVALNAYQIKVGASVILTEDFSTRGGVDLEGARIDGKLILNGAKVSNPKKVAVDLDHAVINLGVHASELDLEGSVRMHHARVGCMAKLNVVKISKVDGPAVQADHVAVHGALHLSDIITENRIDIHGAEIECNFILNRSQIGARKSNSRLAVDADNVQVGGDVLCEALAIWGEFRIVGASVRGSVTFDGATLRSPGGVALRANRISAGSMTMSKKFSCEGSFVLTDSFIATDLDLSDSSFDNSDGRAILGNRAVVKGNVIAGSANVVGSCDLSGIQVAGDVRILDSVFVGLPRREHTHGAPKDPRLGRTWRGVSLILAEAQISGEINLGGSRFGECLNLSSATVGRAVSLDGAELTGVQGGSLTATGLKANSLRLTFKNKPSGAVDLSEVQVTVLEDSKYSWPDGAEIILNDLQYQRLPFVVATEDRLGWLRRATSKYLAQPYDQLAAVYLMSGKEGDGRRIKYESIRRSYQDRKFGFFLWGKIQDWTVGFGYKPLRALLWLVVLWGLGALWFGLGPVNCSEPDKVRDGLCLVNRSSGLSWDPGLYSLDLLVPVVNFGYKNSWDVAGFSKVVMYVLTFMGWVITTTVVAATTRKLRRD